MERIAFKKNIIIVDMNYVQTFLRVCAKALLAINKYKLTKVKIGLCGEQSLILKPYLKRRCVLLEEDYYKNTKEQLCTMSVLIEKKNNKFSFMFIGANGMALHKEQFNSLKYFVRLYNI